jgi:hypothetical protein
MCKAAWSVSPPAWPPRSTTTTSRERDLAGAGGHARRAVHGLITEATKDRVQPIEYIAEGVYQMVSRDPKSMTGRIGHADAFLKELGLKPSELV